LGKEMSDDDEITLQRYQNLFRIAVRAFYDEMAVVAVDYMVMNCKASMTEKQLETHLKVPFKLLRASFRKMAEDEFMIEYPSHERWFLTSNIKDFLKTRIDFIRDKLAKKMLTTAKGKAYKCEKCNKVVPIDMMALYGGKCPTCRGELTEKESETGSHQKINELIKKIEDYIDRCQGREFPSKIYPEEHHKLWESESKDKNVQGPLFTSQEKSLYKKVLEKLNEQRPGKNIKVDENILSNAKSLQEYYKKNPTKVNQKVITTSDVLAKRRITSVLSEEEYKREFMTNLKKIFK
jgi:transcription initiation factor IIE alpha subunit